MLADACARARGGRAPRERSSSCCLRLVDGHAGDPLELLERLARFAAFSSSWSCLRVRLAVGDALLAALELVELRARPRPRAGDALLDLRRSRHAPVLHLGSISARSCTASSRASICASRRSALRLALGVGEQLLARAPRRREPRAARPRGATTAVATAPTTSPISSRDDREHARSSSGVRLPAAARRGCSHPALRLHGGAPVAARRAHASSRRVPPGPRRASACGSSVSIGVIGVDRFRKSASVQAKCRMKHADPTLAVAAVRNERASSASSPNPRAARYASGA